MLGETEAAMERFSQIPEDAPSQIKYAAYYNSGIISQKNANFEEAQNFFRKALEIDNSKLEAKINLEFSMQQLQDEKIKKNQTNTIPIHKDNSEISNLDKSLFKHIKENDQKQWKNSETSQSQNLANDY